MRLKGFLLFFVLLPLVPVAQNVWNFKTADSVTYALYRQQQWDSLVLAGKKALHSGQDYYYLRMRMGIARYMQNKPAFSTPHFRKALKFSKNDPTALSYLYGSYILENNLPAAKKLTGLMSPSLKKQLHVKTGMVESIDVSTGYKTNNNMVKNGTMYLMGADSISGAQLLLKDQWYGHSGISFRFGNAFSLYFGYDRLIVNKTNRFQYSEAGLKRDSTVNYSWGYENYFSDTLAVKEQSFDTKIIQNNLYVNAGYEFYNGLSAGGFVNVIPVKSQKTDQQYQELVKTDTAYFVEQENRYETFEYKEDNYTFSVVDTSFTDYIAGFWIQKNWGFLLAGLEASTGNLNAKKQRQISMELLYYPLGNNSLYGETRVTAFDEQETGNRWLWSQKVGVKLFPKLWAEGEYRQGDFSDVQFAKGFVVYNLPETVNFFAGINLMFYPMNRINLNLRYQYFDQNGKFATFIREKNEDEINKFNYQSNNIILELIWKF